MDLVTPVGTYQNEFEIIEIIPEVTYQNDQEVEEGINGEYESIEDIDRYYGKSKDNDRSQKDHVNVNKYDSCATYSDSDTNKKKENLTEKQKCKASEISDELSNTTTGRTRINSKRLKKGTLMIGGLGMVLVLVTASYTVYKSLLKAKDNSTLPICSTYGSRYCTMVMEMERNENENLSYSLFQYLQQISNSHKYFGRYFIEPTHVLKSPLSMYSIQYVNIVNNTSGKNITKYLNKTIRSFHYSATESLVATQQGVHVLSPTWKLKYEVLVGNLYDISVEHDTAVSYDVDSKKLIILKINKFKYWALENEFAILKRNLKTKYTLLLKSKIIYLLSWCDNDVQIHSQNGEYIESIMMAKNQQKIGMFFCGTHFTGVAFFCDYIQNPYLLWSTNGTIEDYELAGVTNPEVLYSWNKEPKKMVWDFWFVTKLALSNNIVSGCSGP